MGRVGRRDARAAASASPAGANDRVGTGGRGGLLGDFVYAGWVACFLCDQERAEPTPAIEDKEPLRLNANVLL